MKIFISHSSKDKNIADMLSLFLKSIDNSIKVFCTAQIGCIDAGRDSVREITDELNRYDILSHYCLLTITRVDFA